MFLLATYLFYINLTMNYYVNFTLPKYTFQEILTFVHKFFIKMISFPYFGTFVRHAIVFIIRGDKSFKPTTGNSKKFKKKLETG